MMSVNSRQVGINLGGLFSDGKFGGSSGCNINATEAEDKPHYKGAWQQHFEGTIMVKMGAKILSNQSKDDYLYPKPRLFLVDSRKCYDNQLNQ
jgi:hypothetical protein